MKFAIIIPVYNKEQFVEKAIQSVLTQTYNKERQIQIIVINDGSTDNSHEKCKVIAEKNPGKVTYAVTSNRGPSAARNYGFSFVSKDVDVVGYLDADDTLSQKAVEKTNNLFKKFDVDMATLPIKYFNSSGIGTDHSLNYRFLKGDNIINLSNDFKGIHFYAGGLFLKRQIIEQSGNFFEESLQFWEDAYSINKYLLKSLKYGVVSGAYYYYRRNDKDNASIVDEYWNTKARYTNHLNNGYMELIQMSIRLHGKVLPFIQYLIVFHMKLYLFNENYLKMKKVLTEEEQEEFIRTFIEVLEYIDVYIIEEQNMKVYYKSFLIELKVEGWPTSNELKQGNLSKEEVIIKRKNLTLLGLEIIGFLKEEHYLLQHNNTIFISNGKRRITSRKISKGKEVSIWGTMFKEKRGIEFKVTVPYYLLHFTYYLQIENRIVALNSLNYYKRVINKLKEVIPKTSK